MALDEVLTPLAIGIGCRAACPASAIAALVERASAGLDRRGARLFTLERKADEDNVKRAALILGLPVFGLPEEALRAVTEGLSVLSAAVEAATGVPSVAEAAALAGAGTGATLLVRRMAENGATCAIAIGREPAG